jgi:hypothetical protein
MHQKNSLSSCLRSVSEMAIDERGRFLRTFTMEAKVLPTLIVSFFLRWPWHANYQSFASGQSWQPIEYIEPRPYVCCRVTEPDC